MYLNYELEIAQMAEHPPTIRSYIASSSARLLLQLHFLSLSAALPLSLRLSLSRLLSLSRWLPVVAELVKLIGLVGAPGFPSVYGLRGLCGLRLSLPVPTVRESPAGNSKTSLRPAPISGTSLPCISYPPLDPSTSTPPYVPGASALLLSGPGLPSTSAPYFDLLGPKYVPSPSTSPGPLGSACNSFGFAGEVSSTSTFSPKASSLDDSSRLCFLFRQKNQPIPAATRRHTQTAATIIPIIAPVGNLFEESGLAVDVEIAASSTESIDVIFCEALGVHFACETWKVCRS